MTEVTDAAINIINEQIKEATTDSELSLARLEAMDSALDSLRDDIDRYGGTEQMHEIVRQLTLVREQRRGESIHANAYLEGLSRAARIIFANREG